MVGKSNIKAGVLYNVKSPKGTGQVRVKNLVQDAVSDVADCVVVSGSFGRYNTVRNPGDVVCLRVNACKWIVVNEPFGRKV